MHGQQCMHMPTSLTSRFLGYNDSAVVQPHIGGDGGARRGPLLQADPVQAVWGSGLPVWPRRPAAGTAWGSGVWAVQRSGSMV